MKNLYVAGRLTIALLLFILLSCMYQAVIAQSDIFAANKLLAKTLNIGYPIEAASPGTVRRPVTTHDFLKIKEGGFSAVRLPVNWVSATTATAPYQVDKDFLRDVDELVKYAVEIHLAIILDNHMDEELMNEPERYKPRLLSLWQQLSEHYRNEPQSVMFELLAEPHGQLENYWNAYLHELLTVVRKNNPDRPVIIGPVLSNRPQMLSSLMLPDDDRHLIVTFHQYTPVKFTMQDETWFPFGKPMAWLGTQWPATADEENAVAGPMDMVASWVQKNNRPVFMGEFGVSDNADSASATNWIKFNREQAEQRGFSWGYWGAFGLKFNIYNQQADDWNRARLAVLIPGTPAQQLPAKPQTVIKVDPSITAETVLKKHLAASGGLKALTAIRTIKMKGAALMGDQSLILDETYTLPGHYEETLQIGNKVFLQRKATPGSFLIIAQGQLQELSAEDKESMLEESSFFIEKYMMENPGYHFKLAEPAVVDGGACYAVSIITPLKREFTNYYSIETGLRAKTVSMRHSPNGDSKVQSYYKDYQLFKGCLIPTTLINDIGAIRITAHFNSIVVN